MLIFWNSRVLFNRQWLMSCICCEQLHVSRCCSQKKKWTKDEVNSLLAWKYETNAICGPCITPKKARNTVSRAKHKATRDIDNYLLNDSQLAVGIIANELKDVETQTSVLPCSTTRRLSSQTVSEALVEKPRSPVPMNSRASHQVTEKKQADDINNNNADSKHNSKDVFVSTQRQQTCGYTWVDSPAGLQQTDNNENTVMSFTRVTDVDSHNVTQNADQVSHCTSGMMNLELSDTDREQSVENSSAAKRQTAEDKTQKNSSDQHILSFPLFASPVLSSEAASVSVRLPSVSAILKATMPPENQLALTRWEQRMIAELGEDGFQEYQKAVFANGSNLHTTIHQYMSGKSEDELVLLPANHGHWQSIESVLADITDVVCLEKPVRHGHLQYCGVLDCVAEYRGDKHVIEWKTSKRRKSRIQETFDNPLQLVAYLGAYNVQPSTSLQVERCLLVIAYEDGSAADVHVLDKWDCLRYWSNWLQRLHLYAIGTRSS